MTHERAFPMDMEDDGLRVSLEFVPRHDAARRWREAYEVILKSLQDDPQKGLDKGCGQI